MGSPMTHPADLYIFVCRHLKSITNNYNKIQLRFFFLGSGYGDTVDDSRCRFTAG
jgi:hypothetical protein